MKKLTRQSKFFIIIMMLITQTNLKASWFSSAWSSVKSGCESAVKVAEKTVTETVQAVSDVTAGVVQGAQAIGHGNVTEAVQDVTQATETAAGTGLLGRGLKVVANSASDVIQGAEAIGSGNVKTGFEDLGNATIDAAKVELAIPLAVVSAIPGNEGFTNKLEINMEKSNDTVLVGAAQIVRGPETPPTPALPTTPITTTQNPTLPTATAVVPTALSTTPVAAVTTHPTIQPTAQPALQNTNQVQPIQHTGTDIEKIDAPKNIELSILVKTMPRALDLASQKVIIIPADFTDTLAKTTSISVGSRNGILEAWCIAQDGTHLLRYNNQKDPKWVAMTAQNTQGKIISPLKSVAVSSDGEMMILDIRGQAHHYNWNKRQFAAIPAGPAHHFDKKTNTLIKHTQEVLALDYLALGNKDTIWAVDVTKKMIYKLESKTNAKTNTKTTIWMPMVDGIYVSAGLDGFVISIDDEYVPHVYGGKNTWYAMAGIKLDHVAVGTQNYIYGTYQGGVYRHYNNSWYQLLGRDRKPVQKPASGIRDIAVNAVGTIFITAPDEIYHKGGDGVLRERAVQKATPPKPIKKDALKR